MIDPINPFEDIEDIEPEASLPVEAEMPQAIRMIPNTPFPPLFIPASETTAAASRAVRTDDIVQTTAAIRQVSHEIKQQSQQVEWQPIELAQGFFAEEQRLQPQEPEPQQFRKRTVVGRAVVEEARELVPIRRVTIRRRQ